MPDFQRTITRAKALHPDTLLAYEMNGQALPVEHGFPLRVIAPGWAGDSWVKWLQHIEVLDHEFEGFWMKSAYRHPTHPVAPGTAVDPSRDGAGHRSEREVRDRGSRGMGQAGTVRIQGTAWSNSSPVSKVEVSTDGGQSWKMAKLGGQQTKYGWRLWQIRLEGCRGQLHADVARHEYGRPDPAAQPGMEPDWLSVECGAAGRRLSSQRKPRPACQRNRPSRGTPYPDGYKEACFGCHDEHMMQQQRLTRAQWDREINKMTGWGAPLKAEDREAVLNYLAAQFKP